MPLNHTLWSALWDRAAREEIGILIRFDNGFEAHSRLKLARPEGFADYTLCRTPDPNTLLLVRPGVTLNDEHEANIARQIYSDLE